MIGSLPLSHRLLLILLFIPLSCWAHKPSDSYLSLDLTGDIPTGQWDIALRDLEYALGIDTNGDGVITWSELRTRHQAITHYVLARLQIQAGAASCIIQPTQHLLDEHSDGVYNVLRFTLDCPLKASLNLDYQLFFDLDPTHRGLLRIIYPDTVHTAVLSPEQARIALTPHSRGLWRTFSEYWQEGIWHIWIGFDHILFLLALLLPAVLWRDGKRWRQAKSLRSAMVDVAAIVTAFSVAHSITLSMAVLDWVALPSRWVESAIAATVVLAAVNNLYPLVQGRRWLLAFCLGLVHGFGFAGVLADLGLPAETLALALVGFNVGVETGQLAIVIGFMPLAFMLRSSWFYQRAALPLGSSLIAVIALLWLLERSLDVNI